MQIIEGKAEILYPCKWSYRVIGESEEGVRLAVFEVIDKEHSFTPSNQSRTGKYQSFNIELVVESEEERNEIFARFRAHASIKMVI
ncbi:DUF493 domain-containing protein [Wolinella succinogenes]|uniref:Uncharacterized protein n=1 Tax=Wolinella succinogenes (strain ATCC 29543 / DSM 1740 / CCUG 13145 / JCM 31913 / LMG 7466 / NCTC 11488 / FDC 602W) TaxID=273121 RepID=Q7MRK4_WOLSU|nr:DUF493 domain-containing protein [Wolinella succinogenes]CAE10339.1 hypothetical protein WS1260 [Wolinella succinogenes]VEG80369.1 Uncharacterized conserved protein [Wolinella succinogenes]